MSSDKRVLVLFGSSVLFGQERGNIEAIAALQGQGCDVLCLVRDEEIRAPIRHALDARGLRWQKVPYIEHRTPGRMLPFVFRNPIAFIRANWKLFHILREFRPDCIHAFNPIYILNFWIILKFSRIPMVFRAGDEPVVHNWFFRNLWRSIVSRTSIFVANSHYVRNTLIGSGVDDEKIVVIYNRPPARSGTSKDFVLDIQRGVAVICYVGQIAEHKGVHILVDAFRRIADNFAVHLIIAGRISDWSGDYWARALRNGVNKDAKLREKISFVGEIDCVHMLLSRADIHVAPSLFEDPAPNVVMEAKKAACPSIVFPRGGMPELIEHGYNGLICDAPDAHHLSMALSLYLSDPVLVQTHGLAAARSLHAMGIENFESLWMQVYAKALATEAM